MKIHTPGPWTIEGGPGNWRIMADGVQVGWAFSGADAALISSAPDLLRACEAAAAYLVHPRSTLKSNRDAAVEIIFDAARKATT